MKMISVFQNNWAQSHFPTTSSVTIDKNGNLTQGSQEGKEIIFLMIHTEHFKKDLNLDPFRFF